MFQKFDYANCHQFAEHFQFYKPNAKFFYKSIDDALSKPASKNFFFPNE